ncbi:hypothetical protein Micbo1qcDRAFT_223616 [Microdochium bolleyi]|uniref:Uncharacterized protein n=1 Tax=Microdochium bolleyi TaxID=196109 RepID=A0A136IJU5_9PEZI|nr:hypothetical protein Micbo1qcDRAFT_223616 [Microdochium bolleyi]
MSLTHSSIGLRALATAVAISGLVTADNAPTATSVSQSPPDLTGQVPVKGFRLDKPFGTADNSVEGWSLQINMTEHSGGTTDNNRFVVKLDPPAPPAEGALWDAQTGKWLVSDDVSKTWGLTALGFAIMEFPSTRQGNDMDDGSCPDSVFSEQCRKDYVTAILDSFDGWTMDSMVPPKSSINANSSFTQDATFAWSYNVGGQAWLDFKDKTWPFIFVWGPARGSGGELTAEHIHFNCIKADRNAKTGQALTWPSGGGSPNGTAATTTATTSTGTAVAGTTTTASNLPLPTVPTAAASLLQAALSKTVGVAAAIVAVGWGMF